MYFGDIISIPYDSTITSVVPTGRIKIKFIVKTKRFLCFKRNYIDYECYIEEDFKYVDRNGNADSVIEFALCSRENFIKYINNEIYLNQNPMPPPFTGRIKIVAFCDSKESLLLTKKLHIVLYMEMVRSETCKNDDGTAKDYTHFEWKDVDYDFLVKHIDDHILEIIKE